MLNNPENKGEFEYFRQTKRIRNCAIRDAVAQSSREWHSPRGTVWKRALTTKKRRDKAKKLWLCYFASWLFKSFASRLYCWNFRQVRWQFVRLKRFHLQRNQAFKWHPKIHRAVGTIHHHRHADDLPAMRANDVQGFLHASALGHDILDTRIFSPAAILKPRRKTSLPSSFSTKINRSPSCRATSWPMTSPPIAGETTVTAPSGFNFRRQRRAEFFDDGHLLECERALKKLPAVQSAAQNEMAFEQRARVAKNLQRFVFCHACKFQVWRFKIQARLPQRQVGVHASACSGRQAEA